jgi:hypothetical protein
VRRHRRVAHRGRYQPPLLPVARDRCDPSETNEMANVADSRGASSIERSAPYQPLPGRLSAPVTCRTHENRCTPSKPIPTSAGHTPEITMRSSTRTPERDGCPWSARIWRQGVLLVGRVTNPFPSYRKNDTPTTETEEALQRFFYLLHGGLSTSAPTNHVGLDFSRVRPTRRQWLRWGRGDPRLRAGTPAEDEGPVLRADQVRPDNGFRAGRSSSSGPARHRRCP